MKDLILNFSWDKLISLPPSELLAVVVLGAVVIAAALLLISTFADRL